MTYLINQQRFMAAKTISLPRRRRLDRQGIVLLVVLGMLTLFSMLAVSYLVFTSRHRSAAFNISRSETGKLDGAQLVDDAIERLLVGSNGPDSSLWGHDLLGDLYGMRDAIEGDISTPANFPGNSIDSAPEVLIRNTTNEGSQFLRFPTELFRNFTYPHRREDTDTNRQYPSVASLRPIETDDVLNGRLITFNAGPLEGLTFRIVRSFGDHTNIPAAIAGRETLSGQLVIDIRPHLSTTVEIDGDAKTISQWLTDGLSPHRFFYDRVIVDTTTPAVPYGNFYVNGRMLNGPGLGWDLARTDYTTTSGTDYNLNEVIATSLNPVAVDNGSFTAANGNPVRDVAYETGDTGQDIPVSYQGHYALHRYSPGSAANAVQVFLNDLPPGDVDEPYDAPDYNNLWLSYFPNDPELGEPTPSFVRPALVNWILNQQTSTSLESLPVDRLRNILYALQRSTLRPLPFVNDPRVPNSIPNRLDGVLKLRYDAFTGSNLAVGLNGPIDIASTDTTYLATKILDLAWALAGRDDNGDGVLDSWDVDNNGDGIADSLWVDAGMPLQQDAQGRLFKPMVSYMVEDLGGRVNVNLSGNLAQARNAIAPTIKGAVQHTGVQLRPAGTTTCPVPLPNEFNDTDLPNGFGFGPAEVDVRGLFAPYFVIGTPALLGPQRLVGQRLNVWSLTNGREPATNVLATGTYLAPGELYDPITANGNDWYGAIRSPGRANLQNYQQSQGLPMDAYGRTSVALAVDGSLAVSRASEPVGYAGASAGDSVDDPYEFDENNLGDPDAAYRYSELESLLRFDGLDRDLVASRLMDLIDEYHSQQASSRAEQDQITSLRRLLADCMTTDSNSAAITTGALPSEWRDNAIESTAASPPQRLFEEGIDLRFPTTGHPAVPAVQQNQVRNAWLWELLPWEVRSGRKLNLNRQFGNGLDDDVVGAPGYGVIDDFYEVTRHINGIDDNGDGNVDEAAEYIDLPYKLNTGTTRWSSTRGDVTPGEPGAYSRRLLARHLYVLAMFLLRDGDANTDFDYPVDPTMPFTPLPTPYNLSVQDEYRAWKVAQWAVNAVDFRDADATMTRFEYDPYPFDGWDIVALPGPPVVPQSYRVVYGMEFPELSLEESLAFHDRRVRDTAVDDGPAARRLDGSGSVGADPTPDQYRLPQGSLFLELRSTRSPQPLRAPTTTPLDTDPVANPMAFPAELYRNVGTAANPQWVLDLSRLAPDSNPIWRVAISSYHDESAATRELSPDFLLQPDGSGAYSSTPIGRDSVTLDPQRPQFFANTAPTGQRIDRVIWFSNQDPDSDDDGRNDTWVASDTPAAGQVFYWESGTQLIEPGQSMVVAPRMVTSLGENENDGTTVTRDANDAPLVTYDNFQSTQAIQVTANGIEHTDISNTVTTPLIDDATTPVPSANIRPAAVLIASSQRPAAWTTGGRIGVNISEPYEVVNATTPPSGMAAFPPRSYYREPTEILSDQTGGGYVYPLDTWRNFSTNTGNLPDTPFDRASYAELERTLGPVGQKTGTTQQFKTAYLQRLADPTLPWNETTNPYISVDYISLDLTVFNGSMDNSQFETPTAGPDLWVDDADEAPFTTAPDEQFASRYKTGMPIHLDITSNTPVNLRHSVNTFAPVDTNRLAAAPVPPLADPFFRVNLSTSTDVNTYPQADPNVVLARQMHCTTLGYTNQSYGQRWEQSATTPAAEFVPFVGLPIDWQTNVAWLNRPFVSAEELMWVPTSAPGRFAFEFGSASVPGGLPAATDPYDDANNAAPGSYTETTQRRFDFNQRFTHVWNYLSSNNNDFSTSPNYLRLLDWVGVPTPYDSDTNFVSPELDITTTAENSIVAPTFNYSTFFLPPTAGSFTSGNPLEWTLATPRAARDRTYNRNTGAWGPDPGNNGMTNGFWTDHVSMEPFRPPFGFQDNDFRHGLINLNTVKNNRVYKALMYGFSNSAERGIVGMGSFWQSFTDSRRGFSLAAHPGPTIPTTAGNLRTLLDPSLPTQMHGVFAPSSVSDIHPLVTGQTRRDPIESTRLRADPTTATSPIFQRATAPSVAQSHDRSVVHNQLGQTRLSNLASDQSNVFAVWVTVGFFEVDGGTLTVGNELGLATGEAQRLKAFYIIDRSVPVKYEPGKRNNAFDTIRFSRILE
ncbi:hypothetical protein CA13_34680 [Planctomycetes bacterium CA13]|uniref:Uncharacterized protein n=1 Tax=Novipirellula herctigrandis TaxID=2527986 RepID=A0A5C5Z612_9BACT|nr:hypothetical protein CA13_34680 [Planctomycetes bacterium CA13]